jgi:hypothetical protein
VFTIDNRTNAQGPAIDLTGRDYVTFRKIRTNNCQESVEISGCTNIRFEDCHFVAHKNTQTGWPVDGHGNWNVRIRKQRRNRRCGELREHWDTVLGDRRLTVQLLH